MNAIKESGSSLKELHTVTFGGQSSFAKKMSNVSSYCLKLILQALQGNLNSLCES